MYPKVRFWVWWNDAWTKITLRPDERLTVSKFQYTEEGWSRGTESWEWDSVDGYVILEIIDEGSDCDGRYEQCRTVRCSLDKLDVEEVDDLKVPAWETFSSSQRDYSAEAMGY